MKRALALAVMLAVAPAAMAYQVTGPVVEVSATKIVVDKDGEKHEMARNKDTKVKGEIKKGSKVTVHYKMIATSIESKDGAKSDGKKKEEKKDDKKK